MITAAPLPVSGRIENRPARSYKSCHGFASGEPREGEIPHRLPFVGLPIRETAAKAPES